MLVQDDAIGHTIKESASEGNQPKYLEDYPIDDEEKSSFEIHNRVAKAMCKEIELGNPSGIALIGKWGSGKSTVLNLLSKSLAESQNNYFYFLFDAWAHAGDSLRKAFLLSLGGELLESGLVDADDWDDKRGRIEGSQKLETTIQQSEFSPFTAFMIAFAFSYAASFGILSGLYLFPESILTEFSIPFLSGLVALIISLCIAGILLWKKKQAYKKEGAQKKNKRHQTFSVKVDELLSYLTGRPSMTSSSQINTLAELDTIEFQKEFMSLLDSAIAHNDTRLVVAVDNMDRLAPEDIKKAWDTIQIFSGFSFGRDIRPWIILPYSPDISSLSSSTVNNNNAQGVFSKLFIKQFELPEPITTDWKNCFTGYLNLAFPDIELDENLKLFSIVNTLDFGCIDKTPREAKRFINEMVSQKRIYSEICLISIALFCGMKTKHRMNASSNSFVGFLMPFLAGEEEWLDRRIADLHCIKEDCLNELSMMAFGVFTQEAASEAYVKLSIERAIESKGLISFEALALERPGSWTVVHDYLSSALYRSDYGNPWIALTLENLDLYEPKNIEETYWKNQIVQLLVSNLGLCSWPPFESCWHAITPIIKSDTFYRNDADKLYSHILKSVSSHIKSTMTEYTDKDCRDFSNWMKESSIVFLALEQKGFLPDKIELDCFEQSYGMLIKEANHLGKDAAWISRTSESSSEAYFSAQSAIVELVETEGPLDVDWEAMSFFPVLTSPTYGKDYFTVKAFFASRDEQGQIDPDATNGEFFSFEGASSVFSHFIAAWSMLRFGRVQSERAEEFLNSVEIPQDQHTLFLEYLMNEGTIWQIAVIDLIFETEDKQWSKALLETLEASSESLDLKDLGNDYRDIYGEVALSKLIGFSAIEGKEKLAKSLFAESWQPEDTELQKVSVLEFWLGLNRDTANRETLGKQVAQHCREEDISKTIFNHYYASFYIGICNETTNEEFLNWVHSCLQTVTNDIWIKAITSMKPRLVSLSIALYEIDTRPFPDLLVGAIKQRLEEGDCSAIKSHRFLDYIDISAIRGTLLTHFEPHSSQWKETLTEIGSALTESNWFPSLTAADSLIVIKAIMRVGSKRHMDWLVENLVKPGKAKIQLQGKLGETRAFLNGGIPKSVARKAMVKKTCNEVLESIKS